MKHLVKSDTGRVLAVEDLGGLVAIVAQAPATAHGPGAIVALTLEPDQAAQLAEKLAAIATLSQEAIYGDVMRQNLLQGAVRAGLKGPAA